MDLGLGFVELKDGGAGYRCGRIWCMDMGVRYALLISQQVFLIALTVLIIRRRELNKRLEVIVIHFFSPVDLRRHPSSPSSI